MFLIVVVPLAILWLVAWLVFCQPLWGSGPRSAQLVSPDVLKAHVRVLSENFTPRDYTQPDNLKKCADYIRNEFEKTDAKVRVQTYTVQGRSYQNVIARFGSGDDDLVVVGAHYDTCGFTPGADDNASGVAGLIALAGLLRSQPVTQNVELVAYCLEEPPFFRTSSMGSAVHADELREKHTRIRGVLILEMIGYFTDADRSQDFPFPLLRLFYPSRGNFVMLAGRLDQRPFMRQLKNAMKGATDLPVYSINGPISLPGMDFSDHLNYWRHDYDAVMVTDTAFYRNKEYHGPADTWDRLDYPRMSQVIIGVYEAVKTLR